MSKGRVIDSFVDPTRSTFKITKFIFDLAALPKIFWVSATEIINSGSPSRVFQTLAWDLLIIAFTSAVGVEDDTNLEFIVLKMKIFDD